MGYYYILDAHGEPVCWDHDFLAWAQWFETADRTVAKARDEGVTDPAQQVEVSTVFLGLNHQWQDGPPLLWETLVRGGLLDGIMRRYTSRAEALRGHQDLCDLVSATIERS
jgi:hypothetical protein